MTIPKSWQPGDPITADRLNTGNAESLRPRRSVSLGSGSSLVNETLGNQSASAKAPSIRLVVAIEDFLIPETPTDLNGVVDDVPSGLVREIRLNRKSGTHVQDDSQRPFRAYDVTAGLTGSFCDSTSNSVSSSASVSASTSGSQTIGKSLCDVFYVMFNPDSKRWEVMATGSSGTSLIQFQPFDVCEGIGLTCDCVSAVVVTSSCGSSYSPGDIVRVWDQSRGWFEMPEELLFNSIGWAHSVKVTEAEAAELPFDVGTCRFVVISVDCMEQD